MNELQRALGRIEGNQESFYKEWSSFRNSHEVQVTEIERKIDKLNKFKNYATGVVSAVITGLTLVTGIHISKH